MIRNVLLVALAITASACGASVKNAPTSTPTPGTTTGAAHLSTPTATPTIAIPTATPPPFDPNVYAALVRDFRQALDRGDSSGLGALFMTIGDEPRLIWANWGGPSAGGAGVSGGRANLDAMLAAPTLRPMSIVYRKACPDVCPGATGVLVEGWGTRTLEMNYGGSVPAPGGGWAPLWELAPIGRGPVVFVLHSEGDDRRNGVLKVFGLAPSDGFVKIADLP